MLPKWDSKRERGWTSVSDCIVMECVPWSTALPEMVSEEEKLTGGRGPLRSEGAAEWRLLDMAVAKRGSGSPRSGRRGGIRECWGVVLSLLAGRVAVLELRDSFTPELWLR